VLIRICEQFIIKYGRMWICELHILKIVSYQILQKNISVSRIKHKFKELNAYFVLDPADKAANNFVFPAQKLFKIQILPRYIASINMVYLLNLIE
jgi:hypothetical protein